MTNATIFENLLRKAEYALNSKSLVLTYETFGAAKMAYELGAITKEQFFRLNEKLVVNGINKPSAGLE